MDLGLDAALGPLEQAAVDRPDVPAQAPAGRQSSVVKKEKLVRRGDSGLVHVPDAALHAAASGRQEVVDLRERAGAAPPCVEACAAGLALVVVQVEVCAARRFLFSAEEKKSPASGRVQEVGSRTVRAAALAVAGEGGRVELGARVDDDGLLLVRVLGCLPLHGAGVGLSSRSRLARGLIFTRQEARGADRREDGRE